MRKNIRHNGWIWAVLWIILVVGPDANLWGQILNTSVIKNIKLINESGINTANLEFSPAFFGDKIALVHAETVKNKKNDPGINEPFFDLVYAETGSNGRLTNKEKFNSRINSDFHEGPMAYDAVNGRMYFTRAGIEKKRVRGIDRDTSVRKIMIAEFQGANTLMSEFNLNSKYYSVCNPTLSRDGTIMIFSADRAYGFGGMDLYACFFDGKKWTGMVNLGPDINSSGNDVFPYLWRDSVLIFSSDRKDGAGGFDLYISVLEGGLWSAPERFDHPFNSAYDDFGLILRADAKSGYFTSNRPGGKGKDDIYSFNADKSLLLTQEEAGKIQVYISVLDKFSFEPLGNARVEAKELQFAGSGLDPDYYEADIITGSSPGNIILKISPRTVSADEAVTDLSGGAELELKEKSRYLITVTSEEYEPFTIIYTAKTSGDTVNVVLEPYSPEDTEDDVMEATVEKKAETSTSILSHTTVGSRIIFDNIYYNYNSAEILPGAFAELDSLALWMLENPFVRIRLESHTDSRGNDTYNLLLSVKRGESVKSYLMEKGITHDRIEVTGMGESRIRNHCKNGVKCSEREHQYNRRTEVVILESGN